ncbi:MAG: c-type cytochrome biogenesis protein CcmI [Gammaproteobacteria bacterium]|nr:c-type cytochrome biogenesis protein CcmI [Gammaproteobacteria bacterium]
MITFWIITVAMIAVAIAFVAPALLRKHQTSESKEYRDGQNVTIAREHIADLDAELANGTLSQELYDQSKLEIEQTLLFDLEEQGVIAQQTANTTPGKMAFIASLIAIPLITVLLYFQLGTPELIEKSPMAEQLAAEGMPSIETMVSDLKKRLEENPEDPDGWYLMGRTMMMLKQYAAAAESYENTYKLIGDEPMVMLALADATAMAQGGNMTGRPAQLVFDAIAIDPNNTTGLWMAGMIAEEQGKHQEALDLWLRLRPLIADMPSEVAQLDQFIERVANVLNKDLSNLLVSSDPLAAGTTESIGGSVVRVTIQLADGLYTKVNGEETVFIYAKAMQGPKFPLAAARYQVKDLPVSITLDDSNAVMTTSKLSDFKEVIVGARVSYSGDAMTKSGDLIGEVTNVLVGQSPVTVTINGVSP